MNLQETLDTWRVNAAKIIAENEHMTYVNYVMNDIDYEVLNQFTEDNKLPLVRSESSRFYTADYESGFYWMMYSKPVEIKHTYEVINL
jgi:hypothetical protein